MFKPDILVVIEYNLNEPEKTVIRTNATSEGLEELISTWLTDQIGQGKDPGKANDRETYTIKIGLRIEDDASACESDAGNKGLTCGIVMDVLSRLKNLEIREL